ncbi:MAG: ribbon-helix-helix domain-containing protein, partial [Deltaproteobacteria bacterium]|nr:ribbon-helix-helix domain-containing protein [Deltaproteobacteria bacterium]
VYITEEQDEGLKELSRRTRVPVSEYIREGIDSVLNQYSNILPGQLPLISGSRPSNTSGQR